MLFFFSKIFQIFQLTKQYIVVGKPCETVSTTFINFCLVFLGKNFMAPGCAIQFYRNQLNMGLHNQKQFHFCLTKTF